MTITLGSIGSIFAAVLGFCFAAAGDYTAGVWLFTGSAALAIVTIVAAGAAVTDHIRQTTRYE